MTTENRNPTVEPPLLRPETLDDCRTNAEVLDYSLGFLSYVSEQLDVLERLSHTERRQCASGLMNMVRFALHGLDLLEANLEMIASRPSLQ